MASKRFNTPQDQTAAVMREQVGGCGAQVIGASSNINGDFVAFTLIAGDDVSTTGSPAMTSLDIPPGVTVFGAMTNITTGAGTTVIAYSSCK
jgi:hypothetical protein